MPEEIPYEVLDVFTSDRFSGNPLAIVELIEDISQSTKLTIAKEFNLSETVFWHKYLSPQLLKIDIFTPAEELPFAGHPTIGSAFSILDQTGAKDGQIQIKAGVLNVSQASDGFTYAEIPHHVHQHDVRPQSNAVVWSIVKGMTFILVKLDALAHLQAQQSELKLPIESLDSGWQEGLVGTYYYVQDEQDPTSIRCRMFTSFDDSGIEDAATGSAACTLTAYLSHTTQTDKLRVTLIQGVEMGRRSEIKVIAERHGGKLKKMTLGGQAVRVMRGHLTV